jgi:nitroimidazol reductase NimA-like FMN-containing flavoprotein (pyridoxamine 5'-phosphate oxidase superfamily)
MNNIEPTDKTKIRRVPGNAVYDRDVIHAILDEALICHVGFADKGQPFVMPTIPVRIEDRLYIHGSRASRMLRCAIDQAPVCITVTLLDGIVLARSAYHHSMNYRSVVLLAQGEEVTDPEKRQVVFEALTENIIPGRWRDLRPPNEKENAITAIVSFPISEASAKIRTGPPNDEEEDYALPHWAGVIPLTLQAGVPQPDPKLIEPIVTPGYVCNYKR